MYAFPHLFFQLVKCQKGYRTITVSKLDLGICMAGLSLKWTLVVKLTVTLCPLSYSFSLAYVEEGILKGASVKADCITVENKLI